MTVRSTNSDFDSADDVRRFRATLDELAVRARALGRDKRHDATNFIGAARNAMALIEEGSSSLDRERFIEIAQRNIELAGQLVRPPLADAPPARRDDESGGASGGDARNDLRSPRKRDDLDAFGL